MTRLRARLDAGADHPPRRAGAGAARAEPDVRRSVRARLHADRAGARGRDRRPAAAAARRGVERLDLSIARAARDLVSVRARHLDAGLDRLGAGRGGAQGRAHQGRRAARAAGGRALHRVRQDRDADEGRVCASPTSCRSTARNRPRFSRWRRRSRARSEHPIGRAIVERAAADGLALAAGRARRGAAGARRARRRRGAPVVVGSQRLFEQRGLVRPEVAARERVAGRAGPTARWSSPRRRAIGVIGVADEVARAARDTVEMLAQHGIEHVVLLTGDHELAARALAESVGIADYRSALLPEQKLAAVEALRAATARWRWSATASTTRRRWPRRTSASPWASPAPMPRSRPRTSR